MITVGKEWGKVLSGVQTTWTGTKDKEAAKTVYMFCNKDPFLILVLPAHGEGDKNIKGEQPYKHLAPSCQ